MRAGTVEWWLKKLAVLGAAVGVVALLTLLIDLLLNGAGQISGPFFSNFASRFPQRAGVRAPLAGTLWLMVLTAVISFPISVAAALYLQEYAPRNRITRTIQANVANLAGVPSIVYGILGLALFVRAMNLGESILSGALTLSLLTMPMTILVTQEALKRVPDEVREAAYALGASRWQVVRYQVLPLALPGILSGVIHSLARALGETAPLVLVGAVTFIAFTPESLGDPFTALPVQIFNWLTRPQEEFRRLAAAAILVLLALLLGMSGLGMLIRTRFEGRR